jgi:hypothetical protein
VEKKEAVYAKLLNRPKGQGELMKFARRTSHWQRKKKGRREQSQRPSVDL